MGRDLRHICLAILCLSPDRSPIHWPGTAGTAATGNCFPVPAVVSLGCSCKDPLRSYSRTHAYPALAQWLASNYSVKWTAANRRGIFMHCVTAATCLKR